ncbi:MAG: glycosyltransferase family 4 protein [Planctomycetes bacterium]|nr:glycosyltransferase family 4 protein [Planctomycetota bacterium]
MKIALVNFRFSATAGGVERYVHDLAAGLVRRGHEVHCFCHRRPEDAPFGVLFHPVPAWTFYSPLRVLSFAHNAASAIQRVQDTFDVVHGFGRTWLQDIYRVGGGCHREYMNQTYPAMRNPFLRPLKLLDPRHRALLYAEAKIFREHRYRRLTCISGRVREELGRYYGISPTDAAVIYNGFDPEVFHLGNRDRFRADVRREWGVPEGALVALFVGSGFARKGLAHAIAGVGAAVARAAADLRLVVVGRGATEGYRRLAEAAGLAEKVRFLGARTDLARLYAGADALLFPTLYEPFGTVTLEAMATGVPAVVSRVAGSSEVIASGTDGWVVEEPRRAEEIGARLVALLDPAVRARMGAAAALTAARYTIDANLDATLRLYAEVAEAKGRGQGVA